MAIIFKIFCSKIVSKIHKIYFLTYFMTLSWFSTDEMKSSINYPKNSIVLIISEENKLNKIKQKLYQR